MILSIGKVNTMVILCLLILTKTRNCFLCGYGRNYFQMKTLNFTNLAMFVLLKVTRIFKK